MKVKRKALASIASVISGSGTGNRVVFWVWHEVRRGLRQPEGFNARGLRKEKCRELWEF